MKNKRTYIIFGIAIVAIMVCPLLIAVGTSAEIFMWATNDNDWIGFWAEYFGTIVGSLVTLLVLWWTIRDNTRGREREEKIAYYNHLIELQAKFVEDVADYFTLITRTCEEKNNEVYRMAVQAGNRASSRSSEISILLNVRKGTYNTGELIKDLENMCDRVNTVADEFEELSHGQFVNTTLGTKMDKLMDEILEDCVTYIEHFTEVIADEMS